MLSGSDESSFVQWSQAHADGTNPGLIELYTLVADARGCSPVEIPEPVRQALAQRAFTVLWPNFEQVEPPRFDTTVRLETYSSAWPEIAAAHCERLAAALPAARVEHVGSTAVRGLSAKPIIDLMVSVPDIFDETTYRGACEAEGVVLTTRDDHHRYFASAAPHPRNLHIHVCNHGSTFEREHLLFRDYLRLHPSDAAEYAAAKAEAVTTWGHDRFGYTYAKSKVIIAITGRAEVWARETDWSVGPR